MDRLGTMWSDGTARVRAWWSAQSRQLRMLTVAGTIAALVVVATLAFIYGRPPSYETLFSNLAAGDAASITQHLKDDKVPYTLSNDGKTIYVPSSDVSSERVAIAGSGMIKGGGTGYELFDRTNFGMTSFEEKLDKTRAIAGELERTIDGLDPVEAARVHLATPDDTLYSSTQAPTTASIAITTKPGQSLTPQEVRGITMLVANAVENLKPDNVTIINQDGQVLLPGNATGAGAAPDALKMTQEQLLAKQRYETNLQGNIQSMLDETLGAHRAVARVSTKMDFDANSSTSKVYAPSGTVLSQQNKRESYNGTQPAQRAAVGVPGTTSNIGTYQALQNARPTGRYNKSENTANYDISVQNLKHVDAPGKVLQTSIAVLVNSTPIAPTGSGTPAQTVAYQLTPANVAQIRNAVVAAAGLNLAQGDQISVEAIPFNPALTPAGAATQATTVLGFPVWVLLALGGVGVLVLLGLVAARARTSTWRSSGMPSFDASLAEELPSFEDQPMLDGAAGLAPPIRSAADLTREQMMEYVTTVAHENPESVSKLVKLWLAE